VVAEARRLRRAPFDRGVRRGSGRTCSSSSPAVAPATLALDNVIDVLGDPATHDAGEAVALERLRPEPTSSASTPSALRMVGARLAVRARRHAADARGIAGR
jgi:hypothetical protein